MSWRYVCLLVVMALLPASILAEEKLIETTVLQRIQAQGAARVIVQFAEVSKPGRQEAQALSSAQARNYLDKALEGTGYALGEAMMRDGLVRGLIDGAALERLKADPLVSGVFEDTLSRPALYDTGRLVNAAALGAKAGHGQIIAVIDTGVDRDHPFLKGRVVLEACFSSNATAAHQSTSLCPNKMNVALGPGAAKPCNPREISACGHGTHVAGIAAGLGGDGTNASFSGIASGAAIMAIQVFSRFDNPEDCLPDSAPCLRSFVSDQLDALEYVRLVAKREKVAVVNMSLGGGRHFAYCDGETPLTALIRDLREHQILTVAAAGNEGLPWAIGAPACVSPVISVGASTKSGSYASFSNFNETLDVVAPGSSIVSANPGGGYVARSGTSMATPVVAGIIAGLRALRPHATVDQIEWALKNTGRRVQSYSTTMIPSFADAAGALRALDQMGATASVEPGTQVGMAGARPASRGGQPPQPGGQSAMVAVAPVGIGAEPAPISAAPTPQSSPDMSALHNDPQPSDEEFLTAGISRGARETPEPNGLSAGAVGIVPQPVTPQPTAPQRAGSSGPTVAAAADPLVDNPLTTGSLTRPRTGVGGQSMGSISSTIMPSARLPAEIMPEAEAVPEVMTATQPPQVAGAMQPQTARSFILRFDANGKWAQLDQTQRLQVLRQAIGPLGQVHPLGDSTAARVDLKQAQEASVLEKALKAQGIEAPIGIYQNELAKP